MIYGEVIRGAQGWDITCEPHVRARLKRVFARAPQWAATSILVSDTPENCRDLLWFFQRYPMRVDDMPRLQANARVHMDMEQSIADLLQGRTEPGQFDLAKPPRDYQRLAGSAIPIRGGLLLADEVGTGKTISAMCPMATPGRLPAVVVIPAHLPDHWPEKLAEFAPGLRVHCVRTQTPYPLVRQPRQRMKDLWDELPDVVVISYHKLRGWAETLGEICRYAVFDECQQLRRCDTEIYRAAKYLADKATIRVGLSATPIYNYGAEFFWVVDALLPGALGRYHEFLREWCSQDPSNTAKSRLSDTQQFGAYLRREGIMLRRTRKQIGRELPSLTVTVHTIQSDAGVLEQHTSGAIELAKIIVGHNEHYRGQKMQAAGEFDTVMRQATGVAKAPYVAEFVRMLVESGEQVILYGWHHAVYDIWLEQLADFNPMRYTGTESPAQKRAAKAAFMSGQCRVIIMSLRAVAGLDGLQDVCQTVVFGELDWSPGIHAQCIGRPWRDGQQLPCFAWYLVSEQGSDPVVVDVLGIKREQSEGVCDPEAPLVERIDTGQNQLRKLAEQFLAGRGITAPAAANLEATKRVPEDAIA